MLSVGIRVTDIVIDCADARRAAEFWCAALGYRVTASDETGVVIAGDPAQPALVLLVSTDPKRGKNRVHLDVCPTDGSTRDDEIVRLEAFGATRVDVGQSGGSWVVMADPDGNEFCVMDTVVPAIPASFRQR